MGHGRTRRAGRVQRLTRLCKAVACLALAGATALACGGRADDDPGGSGDGDGNEATSSAASGGTSTSPGPVASFDDLLRELPAIACRNDCNDGASLDFVWGADCLEIYTLLYESLGASIRRSLDAGTVSFDASAAQRCTDEFAESACGTNLSPTACDEVLVGLVPIAGACTASEECAGNAYCEDTLACPGTCAPTLDEGAACAYGGECGTGLVCSEAGVCGPTKALGEPCASSAECQTRYCSASAADRRCAEPPQYFVKALGESCEFPYDCQRGLYCPIEDAVAAVCTPAPKIGEPCQVTGLKTACADGSYCAAGADGNNGTCVVEVPLGGGCGDSIECAAGVCDGGLCVKQSGLGGPCVSDARCFGVCEGGLCAPYPACPEQ